jgi:hypothetical protein
MKGQFYSMMIALFIIPILALIIFYSQIAIPQNIDTNIRANELQYFSNSIEEDLSRFIQINGKRALIASVSMVITNGIGLDNATLRFAEMIENGTLYGNQIFVDQKNLTTWEKNINDIATSLGFNISFSNALIIVTQNDSFSILFNTTLYNVNISDTTAGMGVLKNISVAAIVSVDDIEDPLYANKTYANVSIPIRRSTFNKYSNITNPTDLSNLTFDIINSYYHSSTKGASFLDRLEGKTNLSPKYQPYGLESFIYLPNLTGSYQSSILSDLDYQFWNNTHGYLLNNSYKSYNPTVYSWFRIGNLADNDYGINSLLNLTS